MNVSSDLLEMMNHVVLKPYWSSALLFHQTASDFYKSDTL